MKTDIVLFVVGSSQLSQYPVNIMCDESLVSLRKDLFFNLHKEGARC